MKYLIPILLIVFVSCGQEKIELDDLKERKGLYYKKYSEAPYTGKVIGRVQGQIKKGKKQGKWLVFYKNGQLKTIGNYKDGQAHGEWLWHDEIGELTTTHIYKDDELIEVIYH